MLMASPTNWHEEIAKKVREIVRVPVKVRYDMRRRQVSDGHVSREAERVCNPLTGCDNRNHPNESGLNGVCYVPSHDTS